ncbi:MULTISPECIES: sigma-54-dependent transcriptional regulator [Pseudoalteromonas]|uniref:Sigma-54 dependent transcriptional regulator n=1 Tax=Pseudoalteromonas obscura TaxID=3048491 RepID=A0ABT7EQF3_9GAMM|nr:MULTISPECIES: sigma-54 dependent transcriptional regulator [Pseudoalteromonas]MBQ4839360.1 sigma-54-dependent Fis family transcriptional regulator [Pseudoalteromonas luteoviolacea]MDK2597200.1 sigma-54 dependent transcriptional regulator [Pseudoalteromonas sp. P94(2023)]
MKSQSLILIVEDNREVRLAARFVLEDFGYQVEEVENPVQAHEFLRHTQPALIMLDMNFDLDSTSGEEGLRFLRGLKREAIDIPVIAITAWSNTDLVVQAMQLGAVDFIEKPWQNQRLEQVIQQQLTISGLQKNNTALKQVLKPNCDKPIWQSTVMQQLMAQLNAVAQTDANILITGENGVGKSHIATWIHNQSQRNAQPFISLNMAAIPEQLFESELFGHVKGAFTDAKSERVGRFALAHQGTLFLDEIGTLPLAQQAKLLRVLETGEFEMVGSSKTLTSDVRLISATNAEFEKLIAKSEFRQDLYYRLNTFAFTIPALRERIDDIVPLAEHFLTHHGAKYNKPNLTIAPCAKQALIQYDWPGNTRELSHLIERAVLLCQDGVILARDLHLPHAQVNSLESTLPEMTLEEAEKHLIVQALNKFEGNKNKAAQQLGITKQALYRRLEKYALEE